MTSWRDEPVMARRRRIALQESRALRCLVHAHGRIPAHAPTDWEVS